MNVIPMQRQNRLTAMRNPDKVLGDRLRDYFLLREDRSHLTERERDQLALAGRELTDAVREQGTVVTKEFTDRVSPDGRLKRCLTFQGP